MRKRLENVLRRIREMRVVQGLLARLPSVGHWRTLFDRMFPLKREIILRNDGRVRYIAVGRRWQVGAAAAAVVAIGWSLMASVGFLSHTAASLRQEARFQQEIDQRDQQIASWRDSRERLEDTLERYRDDNASVTRSLQENQSEVERLGTLNAALADRLGALAGRLDETRAARDAGEQEHQVLEGELGALEAELGTLAETKTALRDRLNAVRAMLTTTVADSGRLEAERDELEGRLTALSDDVERLNEDRGGLVGRLRMTEDRLAQVAQDRDEIIAEREALATQIAAYEGDVTQLVAERSNLRQRLASAETKLWSVLEDRSRVASERDALQRQLVDLNAEVDETARQRVRLSANLATRSTELSALRSDRDQVADERDALADETVILSDRLDELEASQAAVLARLERSAGDSVERLEVAIEMTGLDLYQLLTRADPQLARGPAQTALGGPFVPLPPDGSPGSEMASRLASLNSRVDTWRGLQMVLGQLPLAAPVDIFQVTSAFGRRKDPLTKRLAMHQGLDLKAPRGTAVVAPAPGRVTFVGWKGAYGKFIEIDHGLGVRTRYAHLSEILVEVGQEVLFRDPIGKVGSTGRSTGAHVHYEVMSDGKQVDPQRFVRAGQYVFKS